MRLHGLRLARFPVLACSVIAALAVMSDGSKAARIMDVEAPPFSIIFFTLAPNTALTIESSSCSAGADPVFHLANASDADDSHFGGPPRARSSVHDDNSAGGVNARVTRSPSTSSRRFALIVRAANNTSSGFCSLVRNGVPWHPLVMVGGHFVNAADVTGPSSNLMHTQLRPGGSVLPAVATLASNNLGLTSLGLGNGAAGSSVVLPTYTEPRFMVGTPWVADELVWLNTPRSGAAKLLVNGGHDNDDDGLGHLLENELLTCAEPTCPNAHHGSDTDRDGLTDSEEVLGIAGQLPNGSDDIALSRWGAHPLQKDAFVEVDHIADLGPPNAFGENPFQRMRLNNESVEDWVDEILNVFVPTTDQNHLKNPRGGSDRRTRSLRVHLDLGVAPLNAANEWKFGDYGGASRRSLDREVWINVTGPVDWFAIQVNGGNAPGGVATGLSDYETAVLIRDRALQIDAPIGPFTVGGLFQDANTGPGWFFAIRPSPGQAIDVDLWLGGASGARTVPESFESIRSHYELDDTQVDAIRRGKFRYSVIHLPRQGQAGGARFISQLKGRTFAHELGHTLGMEHWGHDDWGARDIECIPHYLGLMRYGDDSYMRLNELDNVTFNPANAKEVNPFGTLPGAIAPGNYSFMHCTPPDALCDENPWSYWTPPGAATSTTVDLNRDGVISSDVVRWRTMALTLDNADCISLAQGAQVLQATTAVAGGLDLVRFTNRLFALWATGSEIRYQSSLLGLGNTKSCQNNTTSSDPYLGTCLNWTNAVTLPQTASALGVTAQVFGGHLFVAFHDSSSNLQIRRYAPAANATWSLVVGGTWNFGSDNLTRTQRTPELFIAHNLGPGTLTVAYLDLDGQFSQRTFSPTTSTWSEDPQPISGAENLTSEAPQPLIGSQPPVMKTWPDPTNPGVAEPDDAIRRTYAIFPNNRGQLRFYRLAGTPAEWEYVRSFRERTWAKPFLEFRYTRFGWGSLPTFNGIQTAGGHFMLGYHHGDIAETRAKFLLSRYIDRNKPLAPNPNWDPPNASATTEPRKMVLEPIHDTVWNTGALDLPGTSMSMYSDRSIDNVFGLLANATGVTILPHADGSPNHPYLVRSDYRTMEDMVCWRLKRALGVPVADSFCGVANVND